jgi:AbrB family looped-hinge helix DNA binding protein
MYYVGKVGIAGEGVIMSAIIVEGAKVMSKGQITVPKDIRAKLGVDEGDRVVLVWDGDRVVMMNAAVFALRALQERSVGAAQEAGFASEDDVADFVTELRREAGH